MGDILKGYNLGEHGVNVAKSPIHLTDGELVSAQNAEFYVEAGLGALRKRAGLQRFNTSTLSGDVKGVIGVPLPAPTDRLALVSTATGAELTLEFVGSTDVGLTFATVTARGYASGADQLVEAKADQSVTFSTYFNPVVKFNGFIFTPAAINAGSASGGRLLAFERMPYNPNFGSQEVRVSETIVLPNAARLDVLFRYKGFLYVGTKATGVLNNYLYQLNPETGAPLALGPSTGFVAGTENLFSGAGFLGKIWMGTSRATQGRIHSLRVGDAAWVVERTAAANLHTYTSMAVYGGNLYAATSALAGTAAIIEKRTPGGTWSTVRTGSHSTQANYFDGLFVHGGELYAFYMTRGGTDICEAHKYNGTSWSTDEDLAALTTTPSIILGCDSFATTLLVVSLNEAASSQRILRRSSAGSWTVVAVGGQSGNTARVAVI